MTEQYRIGFNGTGKHCNSNDFVETLNNNNKEKGSLEGLACAGAALKSCPFGLQIRYIEEPNNLCPWVNFQFNCNFQYVLFYSVMKVW